MPAVPGGAAAVQRLPLAAEFYRIAATIGDETVAW
jgi:hypothetical protein